MEAEALHAAHPPQPHLLHQLLQKGPMMVLRSSLPPLSHSTNRSAASPQPSKAQVSPTASRPLATTDLMLPIVVVSRIQVLALVSCTIMFLINFEFETFFILNFKKLILFFLIKYGRIFFTQVLAGIDLICYC